uniref:Uncharacterized protein n=1 Tax=Arundo donax TaxID=35708 RepID=A0A0A9GBH1_ARUDO
MGKESSRASKQPNPSSSLSLLSTSSSPSSPPASDEEFSPIDEHDGDGAPIDEFSVSTSSASSSSMKNPSLLLFPTASTSCSAPFFFPDPGKT